MQNKILLLKKHWKNIVRSTGSEVVSILLTALSGFIMIQHLPKETYGVYGFLITAVTLIIGLSEIGINHCFLPLLGHTDVSLNRVNAIKHLFRVRRMRLLLISLILVILPTLWLLYQHHWLNVTYTISLICMLTGGYIAVNEQLYRQKYTALQNSSIIAKSTSFSSVVRTIWILLVLYLAPEKSIIILLSLSGAIGSFIGLCIYKWLQKKEKTVGRTVEYNNLDKDLDSIYKPLRLAAFLYILYANFGGMAIGWFGNTTTMANVNAAGRLGMCLVLVDRIVGIFIMPRLAQAPTANKYITLLRNSLFTYLGFVSLIVFSAWLLPEVWLLLIGKKYNDLKDILWLCFLGVILSNLSGFVFTCMTARGFTSNQLPIFITAMVLQIFAIYFLGMYTAKAVFMISIITSSVFAIGNIFLLVIRLKKLSTLEI